MREHLRMRRLSLRLEPLAAAAAAAHGGSGGIGKAFLGFFSSVSSSDGVAVASLAGLQVAAVQRLALVVAFASRSSLLLLMIGLFVETSVGVAIVLSYAAWYLIFAVGTLSATFCIA